MSGVCRVIAGVSGSPGSFPALRYAGRCHALADDLRRAAPDIRRARTGWRLQAAGPGDRYRRDERRADLELDLGVGGERDVAGVALVQAAVVDRGDMPAGRPDLPRPERQAPLVEEVAQGVDAVHRRLDVDNAVGGMGVQPVEAVPADDERALGGVLRLRPGDPDPGRDLAGRAGTAVVLDVPQPAAYCLPGRPGTIVLTSGALAVLDPAQLTAVLAHERAHLRERHDLVLLPFTALRRAFPRSATCTDAHLAVALLVEMLADDHTLRTRPACELVSALVRFGTAGTCPAPAGALAAGGEVAARVSRLMQPVRPLPTAAVAAICLAAALLVAAPVALLIV